MWIYQEILFETKPGFVIETGTAHGGSALFLAHMCDLLGKGRIVTIDIEEKPDRPSHDRITYLKGSSTSEEILFKVRKLVGDTDALVVLDSDHSKDHVLAELRAYSRFVKEGGYLIVEDTNVNGHPVLQNFGPGPMEAVEEFVEENRGFFVDEGKEKFLMTFNPRGYLKKAKTSDQPEPRPANVATARPDAAGRNPRPENLVWIFGSGRSGSTWLASMLAGLKGFSLWNEPYVGQLFADLLEQFVD